MKKTNIIILILALMFGTVSCDFLTEQSLTEVESKDYITNAKEAESVLLGVYRTLIEDAAYGMNLSFFLNMGTDISQVEGSTTENWRNVPTNAFPTTQSHIQETWQVLYKGVYRANDFLERISVNMDSFTEEDYMNSVIYIAEARCLRAMFYFELVRRWNNIPLMTSTAMSYEHPSTLLQADPRAVYEFIEKDLLYAIEVLPYAADDIYRSDSRYRFSKGSAMGLLAKVYCTWAGWPVQDTDKWQAAADIAGRLIKSGKHDLLPDYEQLWKNTCNGIWDPTESLIEISFYSPTTGSGSSDPCGRIGKWNGVRTTALAGVRGSCAANQYALLTFTTEWKEHPGDLRMNLSVANYKYSNDKVLICKGSSDTEEKALANDADPLKKQKEKQTYTPAKWDEQKYVEASNRLINNDKSNINWYFLRYSDVLLLYAEALNEVYGGPTTEAYSAINKVRRRGYGNPDDTSVCDLSGLDYESFREAVRKERAYELAFEGHRRTDLVRWGIYYETIQKTDNELRALWNWSENNTSYNYVVAKYTVKDKSELLPIPQREKDLCKQFKQNPGWE